MKRNRVFRTTGSGAMFVLFVGAVAAFLSACSPRTTPPGADIAGGTYQQASCSFLRWKEGLRIMIWTDLTSVGNHGSGSTTDPVYRLEGEAVSQDGQRVEWRVETSDGKTAQFWIDDVAYELADGSLFIIRARTGATDVEQLDRDLSDLDATYESCVEFAQRDPDLAGFLEEVSAPQ
jgi:hypothetical protein